MSYYTRKPGETGHQAWVRNTRESVVRELSREQIPVSAQMLEGSLDLGHWTDIGLLGHRTAREISAALRWAVAQGYAEEVLERDPEDPPGKLYRITWPAGQNFANSHPKET